MKNSSALYNSRIFQSYLDYLSISQPHLKFQDILDYAGMTRAEVADSAHWFTQEQADRFYQIIVEKTGDPDIARKAGRFGASSKGLALTQQYVTGLMNTETALLSMAKIISFFTKGATVEAKRLAPGKVEIISTPNPDAEEKPYQCENRLGSFEAVPKLFTNVYGHVEHPYCFHRGEGACHYIISWDDPQSLRLKLWRNYALIGAILLAVILCWFLPAESLQFLLISLFCLVVGISLAYAHIKIKELEKIIEHSHSTAEERIEVANTNYNNSLLVQEIGQATAAILNVEDLMDKVATLMYQRLSFDRGLIMLADQAKTHLVYTSGYGYSPHEEEYLRKTTFHLDKPDSKGFFVKSFWDKNHLIIKNANELAGALSEKSRHLLNFFRVRSLMCIPIIYKDEPLGVLAVDNINSIRPLKKSDINLLEGIASHIAIGINNARSFQKIEESENRYRQTLESIEDGYFEIDLKQRLLFANKAFSDLVCQPLDHLPSSSFMSFFSPDSIKQLHHLFEQVVDTRSPVRFAQLELSTSKGEKRPVDLSVSLIENQNGLSVGFRGFLRDAQDRLQLELERKELEKKLQQAQKMESIGTLAGGIAHNFNNWLAGIQGNIGLIKMTVQEDKVIERIARIEHVIDNAARMNRQLLSYARGGNYEVKPINLNEMIQEAAETFATAKKEIVVRVKLNPQLHTVLADRGQIEQVLWNFYVNATDAMPDGGTFTILTKNVTAEKIVSRYYAASPGDYAMISCSDTGCGILPEKLDVIFEPFYTTKSGKGTGLGLASAYGIVKAHKGYVDVNSEPEVGSTFIIYLPSVEVAPQSDEKAGSFAQMGQGTIMIVDDDEMILESTMELLSVRGYIALGASSGEEALEKYADQLDAVDAFLIDMIMPGMSGGELYARLKKIKPDLKALLCSGYSINENIQAILDQGCQGFLQKPFDVDELSAMLAKVLADKK